MANYDNNLIVIGAGSGGLIAALIAATLKARVTLIEKHLMGGDCLNTGCVPSKTLISAAKAAHLMRHGSDYGLKSVEPEVDFPAVMDRVQAAIDTIKPKDSVERYTELGVNCIIGEAKLLDAHRVEVNGEVISGKSIILATGGTPFVPPIPGLQEAGALTSDDVWAIREQPRRLVVIGGGPIGCELAQSFARLGSQVTLVNRSEHLIPKEDADASAHIKAVFEAEGVVVRNGTDAIAVEGNVLVVEPTGGGPKERLPFDKILVAVGRRPHSESLNLEAAGVRLAKNGTIEVDEYLRTSQPNIFACGDVAGPYQFTHIASHQAGYASLNAMFGWIWKSKVNYNVVPWCTYTEPEVARVGLSEDEAAAQGIACDVTHYNLDDLDRAIAEGNAEGWVKVLTKPGSDKILGATIVGPHAGELITEFVSAMTHGLGLKKIMGVIHIYPTYSEANKLSAGVWRKARAPQGALRVLERVQGWLR
jgi:pyruvate/2-oxoglutarate dehydrogenase complex dihydrolipoamide dehydrogenase (E3) component